MNKPQQKSITAKPKSTANKPRKRVTKKNIKEEVYNSISPRNIFYASIAGILCAVIIIVSNQHKPRTEETCFCENATAPIRSKTKFKDINPEQLAHAQANGLKKIIICAIIDKNKARSLVMKTYSYLECF